MKGFDVYQWTAIFAPARTPKAIFNRLNTGLTAILKLPAARDKLQAAGFEAHPASPEEVARLIRDVMERWGKLIQELKLDLR